MVVDIGHTMDDVELIEDTGDNEVRDVLSIDRQCGLSVATRELDGMPEVIVQTKAAW